MLPTWSTDVGKIRAAENHVSCVVQTDAVEVTCCYTVNNAGGIADNGPKRTRLRVLRRYGCLPGHLGL